MNLLPPEQVVGTPRAKSDEMGVDLCPGELQLIYCLSKGIRLEVELN
jgi:hypothetical protein